MIKFKKLGWLLTAVGAVVLSLCLYCEADDMSVEVVSESVETTNEAVVTNEPLACVENKGGVEEAVVYSDDTKVDVAEEKAVVDVIETVGAENAELPTSNEEEDAGNVADGIEINVVEEVAVEAVENKETVENVDVVDTVGEGNVERPTSNIEEPTSNGEDNVGIAEAEEPANVAEEVVAPEPEPEELITLNFSEGAEIRDVLTAYSIQTGRSVVLGPDVMGEVRLHLKDVPWSEALEVILEPYGFSYKRVGDTFVVSKMEQQAAVEAITPLETRVFKLRYLDAFAVQDMITSMLSKGRGELTTIPTRGQKGWGFSDQNNKSSVGSGGKRERVDSDSSEQDMKDQQLRSRTIVVRDTPMVIGQIAVLLEEIDVIPLQVLIEARIVEVDSGSLRDIGVELGSESVTSQGGNLFGVNLEQSVNGPTPSAFDPSSPDLAFSQFDTGLSLLFQKLDPLQFDVLLHMLEETASLNVLSSPRILTLNNEEAAMVVGEVFPIVETTKTSNGNSYDYTTTVKEWRDIGIQLNVVPQICENFDVRMVIHPVITEIIGYTGGGGDDAITQYPRLSTRETETQIIIKNGQTLAIGGLFKNEEQDTVFKVPFLGDIPLLGVLFRRKTTSVKKLELVIFLTATVVSDAENDLVAVDEEISKTGERRVLADRALAELTGAQVNSDLRALIELEQLRETERKQGEGQARLNAVEQDRRWKQEEALREELIMRLQKQREDKTVE